MTFPTLADVYAARARIADAIRPTPLMRHALLSEETGLDIWVKHENHNPTSAFKVRGGLNLVRSLSPDERRRGVVTELALRELSSAVAWISALTIRGANLRRVSVVIIATPNSQLPTPNHQLPTTNHQPPTTTRPVRPWASGC